MLKRENIVSVSDLVAFLNQQAGLASTLRAIIDAAPDGTALPALSTLLANTTLDANAAASAFVAPR